MNERKKKIGERNLRSKRTFEIVKKCGEKLRHNITHYTNVPKRKRIKARTKTSRRKIGKTKKKTTRNKGKDTGKRTSTGNKTTYSGGETNEDCHERKNYHRMP